MSPSPQQVSATDVYHVLFLVLRGSRGPFLQIRFLNRSASFCSAITVDSFSQLVSKNFSCPLVLPDFIFITFPLLTLPNTIEEISCCIIYEHTLYSVHEMHRQSYNLAIFPPTQCFICNPYESVRWMSEN